ncbi:MAG: UDP-N-acetylmuramoyl-L-alanyl-D-glutamate--2,6-diaminopimelate ligase [Propionibacteriaceae bacterium]|nr:UDP-N-acetylmuramoyl-L-alanyl-D-glutamate--2,6-diaminopimelate ligase [Propionibacteriaceae bacterium]
MSRRHPARGPADRTAFDATLLVTGLSLSSDQVVPGDLYAALPGRHTHGARHVRAALAAGAVAVLTDPAGAALIGSVSVPVVVADQPRAVLAEWAARLAGRPAERLTMIGVTGTNGKTTTVALTAALLSGLGLPTATIGTLGVRWRGRPLAVGSTTITTPEAPQLQAGLARLLQDGCRAVALEASSHALDLRRVDAIRFAAVGLTNLGSDHLDYHLDQERYWAAKARLFEPERAGWAVINGDDPAAAALADGLKARGQPCWTVGRGAEADLRIAAVQALPGGGSRVRLQGVAGAQQFDLGLPGGHNVTDAALAVGLVRAAGLDPAPALDRLAAVTVPGRLQPVALPGEAPRVYVDFAHTPQAVAAVLAGLSGTDDAAGAGDRASAGRGGDSAAGRLIVVLGAGGDRDAAKRQPMGRAAAAGADVVIVTDDNPRWEDPAAIRRAVLDGAAQGRAEARPGSRSAQVEIIDGGERRHAIRAALAYAGPRDVVAVLGKGHETTQELAGRRAAFDDAAVIAQEWARLGGAAAL